MINIDSIKIGIVSDNEVIRNVLRILLINHYNLSFDLVLELDSLLSIQLLDQANGRPEVILLDVSLLRTNDMEGLSRLQKHFPNCLIIMLADMKDDQDTIRKAMQAGAKGYLEKSAKPEELTQVIINAIQGNFQY
ncbi:MAG TPA: response regulator transcription factor [Pseudosphingobacterium sp.]|nr:response regulator transcription factor [Pseudosphingobacterium sp.]